MEDLRNRVKYIARVQEHQGEKIDTIHIDLEKISGELKDLTDRLFRTDGKDTGIVTMVCDNQAKIKVAQEVFQKLEGEIDDLKLEVRAGNRKLLMGITAVLVSSLLVPVLSSRIISQTGATQQPPAVSGE